MNTYGYIYKTTIQNKNSTLYKHYYIGQHKHNLKDKYYFGSGKIISDYIKTHGTSDLHIEILEYAFTLEELNKLEEKYVTEVYLTDIYCLNLINGGQQAGISEITRNRQRLSHLGKSPSNKQREKQSIAMKKNWDEKTDLEKTRCLINLVKAAKNKTSEHLEKIRRANIGKKRQPGLGKEIAEKRKINGTNKHSEKTKEKISKKTKGKNNGMFGKKMKDIMSKAKYNEMLNKRGLTIKNYKWWNNGIINKRCPECPEGFVAGRLKRQN